MHFDTDDDRVRTEQFFADRPVAWALLVELAGWIDAAGGAPLKATKSRVAFVLATRFLWIHEAQLDSIWLGWLSNAPIESARVRCKATSKSRFSNHTKMTTLDDDLRAWTLSAYQEDAARC